MRIALICPEFPDDYVDYKTKKYSDIMIHTPLSLYLLAALTPGDVDIEILDENREEIDFDQPADLVGITVMEQAAPRAKEIARIYQDRGIKTVMGGFYPTLIPEEAIRHCDSIVVGEAETVWRRLIQDFKVGNLQRIYKSDSFIDMREIPIIRREVIPEGHRFYHVETTRGCPYRCEFCCVTTFYGNHYRNRPVEHVLEQISEIDDTQIMFVDDNIVSNPKYARGLFERLAALRKLWFSQCSINIAKSDELVGLAADSGCYMLFIGFETLQEAGMREINKKRVNPETYPALIKRIHDAGIMIEGSFIFGLDHDDKSVFERTVAFCLENSIEAPEFFILRPHRGTRLGQRLIKENRVRARDLESVTTSKVHFDPLQMSRQELEEGYKWAWKQVYSKQAIKKRLSHILPKSTMFKQGPKASSDLKFNLEGMRLTKEDFVIGWNMAVCDLMREY